MTVINKIRSLFDDRRKEDQSIFGPERREMTREDAHKRVMKAAQALDDTITLSGEKIQEMIKKAGL